MIKLYRISKKRPLKAKEYPQNKTNFLPLFKIIWKSEADFFLVKILGKQNKKAWKCLS